MITIGDIMSKPILMADWYATLNQVINIMLENKIGSVLVSQETEALGIITERDLVAKALLKGLDKEKTRAKDIMNSPILQMDKHLPVYECASKMSNCNVEHIVVTDEEGPVGILSARDIAYYACAT